MEFTSSRQGRLIAKFVNFNKFLLIKNDFIDFHVDRFWQDAHVPVADTLSFRSRAICCASTNNCADTRTWNSSDKGCPVISCPLMHSHGPFGRRHVKTTSDLAKGEASCYSRGNSSEEVSHVRTLLTQYSSSNRRQTVLASASIPRHGGFINNCIQKRWTKADVLHIHVNKVDPFPSSLSHRFTICHKSKRHEALLSLLKFDAPESGIVFVGKQSKKSKKAGNAPPTTLVATDIAARGIDLPETTHIYNFDLPRTAVDYLHRAGRTGRKPFSDKRCFVTSILTSEEVCSAEIRE